MKEQVNVCDKNGMVIGRATLQSAQKAQARWPEGLVLLLTYDELRVNALAEDIPTKADNPIVNLDAYAQNHFGWKVAPGHAGAGKTQGSGKSHKAKKGKHRKIKGGGVVRPASSSWVGGGESIALYMQQRATNASDGSARPRDVDHDSPGTEPWLHSVSIRPRSRGAHDHGGHAIAPADTSRSRAFEFERLESSHSYKPVTSPSADASRSADGIGEANPINSAEPIMVPVIDRHDMPVQRVSSDVAQAMLKELPSGLAKLDKHGGVRLSISREAIPAGPGDLLYRLKRYCNNQKNAMYRHARENDRKRSGR